MANKIAIIFLGCFAVLTTVRGQDFHSTKSPGIANQKPAVGPAIQVDSGWMVPYKQLIPGTDIQFEMVPVSGGVFLMGSPDSEKGRKADEGPQVKIEVDPMWVGKYEVSNREYDQYCDLYSVFKEIERTQRGYAKIDRTRVDVVSAPTAVYDPKYLFEFSPGPDQPAVAMTRYAAQQYTKWLSVITDVQYRLPTEAEWEFACRGAATTRFSWGDDEKLTDRYAGHFDSSAAAITPELYQLGRVGKKLANGFGLHDMHGNAAEWTIDAYFANGYDRLKKQQTKTQRPLPAIESVVWPKKSTSGVVRGGNSDDLIASLRCAARTASNDELWKDGEANLPKSPWWYTSDPARMIGFRLFRSYRTLDKQTISKFWNHTTDDTESGIALRLQGGRGAVGIVTKPAE